MSVLRRNCFPTARRVAVLLALGCLAAAGASAQTPAPAPAPASLPDSKPAAGIDRNDDGKIDYVSVLDRSGALVEEQYDYNYDGEMDDFCFYENGVLAREEIDSDFNGKVDIWVYLLEGKYVQRWERDMDGDGKPDQNRVYGAGE